MVKGRGKEHSMTEDHLDCQGHARTFRLEEYANHNWLEAVELRKGEHLGLRFVLPIELGEAPPWGEIRDKIRARLSQRDIARGPDGELRVLHNRIRAQLIGRTDEGTPLVFVDDLELTWNELGALLAMYEGSGLRIEICNCGEE